MFEYIDTLIAIGVALLFHYLRTVLQVNSNTKDVTWLKKGCDKCRQDSDESTA